MFISKLLPQGLGDVVEEETERAKELRDEEGCGEICCHPETV